MPIGSSSRPRGPLLLGALTVALALGSSTSVLAQGPSVLVEPAGALAAGPATLTVTGTGFATTGNGIYVVFGPVTPAPGYYTNPGIYGAFTWVHVGAGGSPIEAELGADGSFSTELHVTPTFSTSEGDVDCTAVECAVITFAAHGSPDRSQDTCTPVGFVGSAPSSGPVPDAASALPAIAPSPSAVGMPGGSGTPTQGDGCSAIGGSNP